MKRTLATIAAFALLPGIAGCAEDKPTTAPTPVEATSSTPTASPTPTPPSGVPAAARARTDEGALAFADYYIDLIYYATSSGDTKQMRAHALPSCESCTGMADIADRVYQNGGRITGAPWRVSAHEVLSPTGSRERVVALSLVQPPSTQIDSKGAAPRKYPGGTNGLNMALVPSGPASWSVKRMEFVS